MFKKDKDKERDISVLKRDKKEMLRYLCHIFVYNTKKNKKVNGDPLKMRIDTKLFKDSFGMYYNLVLDSMTDAGILDILDGHMHKDLKNGGSYGKCRLFRLNLDIEILYEDGEMMTEKNRYLNNLLDYGGNDEGRKKRLYRFKRVAEEQAKIIRDHTKINISKEQREQQDEGTKANIDVINSSEDVGWTTDTFMSRVYTPVSNLKGEVRDHIEIEQEETVRVDVRNSIPQHMVLYLEDAIEMDEGFKELVKENRIYEHIMDEVKVDRDGAKKYLFKAIFGEKSYKYGKPYNRYAIKMADLFPELINSLDNIKEKKGYNFIASMIFNTESDNILSITEELLSENIKVLTVHDEFIVKASEKDRVVSLLNEKGLDHRIK